MTQTQQKLTAYASKIIDAPVEKVFEAWIDPTKLSKWFGGSYVRSARVEQDLRVGGRYSIDAEKVEGSPGGCTVDERNRAVVFGTYKEIVPNKKLVFTWKKDTPEFPEETLVTVEFIAKGKSTEVIINHTNFAGEETAKNHTLGWGACLEGLEGFLK